MCEESKGQTKERPSRYALGPSCLVYEGDKITLTFSPEAMQTLNQLLNLIQGTTVRTICFRKALGHLQGTSAGPRRTSEASKAVGADRLS